LYTGRRIGLQVQLVVGTDVQEVEMIVRPPRTDPGRRARNRLARLVAADDHARGVAPLLTLGIRLEIELPRRVSALEHRRVADRVEIDDRDRVEAGNPEFGGVR